MAFFSFLFLGKYSIPKLRSWCIRYLNRMIRSRNDINFTLLNVSLFSVISNQWIIIPILHLASRYTVYLYRRKWWSYNQHDSILFIMESIKQFYSVLNKTQNRISYVVSWSQPVTSREKRKGRNCFVVSVVNTSYRM